MLSIPPSSSINRWHYERNDAECILQALNSLVGEEASVFWTAQLPHNS